ncbi:MAG: hypothetical protein ACLSFJ_06055 [Holdemania filiformis]
MIYSDTVTQPSRRCAEQWRKRSSGMMCTGMINGPEAGTWAAALMEAGLFVSSGTLGNLLAS